MWELVAELYPICRSITGDGVRQTLGLIGRHLDLDVHEVATGTPVLDWTVPREWNLHQAWVKDPSGRKVIDAARSNLHVVGYSTPVDRSMPLAVLRHPTPGRHSPRGPVPGPRRRDPGPGAADLRRAFPPRPDPG